MQRVGVKDFLLLDDAPIIDVRSPAEFAEGHISGAINLPLFTDEERARVGTMYTKVGKYEAIDLGLDIVGPKMTQLANKAKSIAKQGKIKIHCWRGGMRSEKMAWLFELVGLEVTILLGGYKAFRKNLIDEFKNLKKIIVLQGATGTGKTAILKELQNHGEQIIDLEKRANHKGSAFGALGMEPQPSTSQFHNFLFDDLLKLNTSRRIWIESESLTIGKVYLPESLWETMNLSSVIELKIDKVVRAKRIVDEYGQINTELLAASIEKIKNRFGGNRVADALKLLNENKLIEVVMLLLDYYDKAYSFSKEKYKKKVVEILKSNTGEPAINAINLIKIANKLKL